MIKVFQIVVIFIIFVSCNRLDKTRLEIKGYTISDSISNEFVQIDKYQDRPFGRAYLINDSRFEVSTINKIIYSIKYAPLTESEYSTLRKKVTDFLKHEPIHNKGITHSGVKIIGDELYWLDSITGDEIIFGIDNRKDSAYSVWIYNPIITDSLSWLYVPDYDTLEIKYEIIDF